MSEKTVYRLNISATDGRSRKLTIDDKRFGRLEGMHIGETLKGGLIGFPNYEFQITGGSDSSGFPMVKDIQGPLKKKILVSKRRVGYKPIRKGQKRRKMVRGNEITADMTLVNLKVVKMGESELFETK
ncbi:MAG: 30S ribosomal protein S6e [Promethearchaeota archaeon]|nr:MAG: 30S ribosomal protein S6e [Candidatus Lokiarchaeota archaeon]